MKNVLYVPPSDATTHEQDDLNDLFLLYAAAKLDVKMAAASAFFPDANEAPRPNDPEGPPYYYGGERGTHLWFWHDYPWIKAPLPAAKPPTIPTPGKTYAPSPRTTPYSSGLPSGSANRPKPEGFGTVPVMVAAATGAILGAAMSRSGSWNRSSGGSGG